MVSGCREVEWWNGGMEERWKGGMEEWRNGGMVEWWNGVDMKPSLLYRRHIKIYNVDVQKI